MSSSLKVKKKGEGFYAIQDRKEKKEMIFQIEMNNKSEIKFEIQNNFVPSEHFENVFKLDFLQGLIGYEKETIQSIYKDLCKWIGAGAIYYEIMTIKGTLKKNMILYVNKKKKFILKQGYYSQNLILFHQKIPQINLVVIGEVGVGKASLVQSIYEIFQRDLRLKNYIYRFRYQIRPFGVRNISNVTIIEKKIEDVSDFDFSNFHVAWVVYDTTNRISFDRTQFWCEKLKNRQIQTALIGSKIDLVNERQVTEASGMELGKCLGIPFFEVSAKELNIEKLVKDFLKPIYLSLKNQWCSFSNAQSKSIFTELNSMDCSKSLAPSLSLIKENCSYQESNSLTESSEFSMLEREINIDDDRNSLKQSFLSDLNDTEIALNSMDLRKSSFVQSENNKSSGPFGSFHEGEPTRSKMKLPDAFSYSYDNDLSKTNSKQQDSVSGSDNKQNESAEDDKKSAKDDKKLYSNGINIVYTEDNKKMYTNERIPVYKQKYTNDGNEHNESIPALDVGQRNASVVQKSASEEDSGEV